MGSNKQITPRKRAIVLQYHKDGLKQVEICRKLKMARSTVSQLIRQFNTTGSSSAGKSSGRPRVTSKRDDTCIGRCSRIHPTYSSSQIKVETGVTASCRTIRRRLFSEFHLPARRPAKKPLLNKQQRLKRVKFCRKYLHWTSADWAKVLFSDETTLSQFGTPTTLVRRPPDTRYLPRYTVSTMKHPPKIMVWGCFSAAGRGSLYFVPPSKMVNAVLYKDILNSKLQSAMNISRCSVFQHDSAPAHSSALVRRWLADNGIEVLEWPGNSPDLNPIENLWMVLKKKVRVRQPKNMQDLVFHIKRVWCTEMLPELCKRLVDSMPRRLGLVIKNRGFATKY